MAIAMASVGGAGFLHYNMTLEDQLANLKAVKAHRLGYVTRPRWSPPRDLSSLDDLAVRRGFTSSSSPTPGRSAASSSACAPPATTSSSPTAPRRGDVMTETTDPRRRRRRRRRGPRAARGV